MAALACKSPAAGETAPPDAAGPAPPAALNASSTEVLLALSEVFYQGYLAETIDGDRDVARRAYERVLEEGSGVDPELAARAALRLAELHAAEGRRRDALDLLVRAEAMGGKNPDLVDAAYGLRIRLAQVAGGHIEVRGPAAGTVLEGVRPETAEEFRRAEELLVSYYALRVKPRLEEHGRTLKRKRRVLDEAIRAYRKVEGFGEPVATAAARFRIATLYHDFALVQAFDLPPELLPELAESLRRQLRRNALDFLKKARRQYAAALETPTGDATLWHTAARAGARAVEDILRRSL